MATAMMNWSQDLTKNGQVCPEKAILQVLASGTETAFDVYFRYFTKYKLSHSHVNLMGVESQKNRAHKMARKKLFNAQRPDRPPAFMDFESWSVSVKKTNGNLSLSLSLSLSLITFFFVFLQDVNRLAVLENCHLVFYWMSCHGKLQDHKVTYLRDFRQDFPLSSVRYFVFKENGIYESYECLDRLILPATYFFSQPFSWTSHLNLVSGLAMACNFSIPPCQAGSLNQLEALSAPLWTLWQQTILVVSYKGGRGKLPNSRTSWSNYVKPSRGIFEVHSVIASPDKKISMAQLDVKNFDQVVCNYGKTNWCKLKPAYLKEVFAQCETKINHDVLRDPVETLEVGRGGTNLFKHSNDEKRQALREKKKKRRLNGCDKINRYCRCPICTGTAYQENMSRSGPEKLLARPLSVGELLKALGQDSWDNVNLLEELSRLSVAAFDIESMTVSLDHSKPAQLLPQADIDSSVRGQHNVATQKPIMLAHRDALMTEEELCPVFTLTGNEENCIYQLIREYWKFVQERQQLAAQKKRVLAQPLLDLLKEYEIAYIELAKNWQELPHHHDDDANDGEEESKQKKLPVNDVVTGWRFSLPGRLARHLNVLIQRYEVFSFYGAGYDQVLLTNYLIPHLFEKRLKPKIEKNGNKVNVIKIVKCHVTFRDVVKLVSPGTSLKQFGELFNLQQAKANFPFALLTGVEALQIESLPTSLADWQSELSSSKKALTLEDVAEAHRLFRISNCQNVGDYLKTYLRLDVDILYKATQGWRQTIGREIGVDFVQLGKFTISSLSNFAGDLCASQNLQIGQFFPNSSAVYRLLRKGMRG